jgi:catechol 2,3-dioxygenase-like lactoylglutathione lyase family enzyme
MKRFHIHLGVENLDESIRFYSALFGVEPAKTKNDYAKWMLDDPRLNFAISTRSGKKGVDHMGIQVDSVAELDVLRAQLSKANVSTHSDGDTVCCYARSEKSWVEDPSGMAWEAYHTMEDAQMFSGSAEKTAASGCATPASGTKGCC